MDTSTDKEGSALTTHYNEVFPNFVIISYHSEQSFLLTRLL